MQTVVIQNKKWQSNTMSSYMVAQKLAHFFVYALT